jgi:dTDP-4-amino-4,6-dideoxygalactose transaminase
MTPMTIDNPAIAGGEPTIKKPLTVTKRYGREELRQLKEALAQNSLFYAHGKKVKQLEADYAAMMGFKYGIATSSGTATIHTAIMAAGISPGDEVIVPPITDMGTIVPVLWQGAIPIFADLDPHTYTLSPESVEKHITPRTKGIVAVHLAGNACDMDALMAIARKHNLAIVEDCAQAHGCLYKGKAVGHFGVAGCYSFNEFKHIGCGDGGVMVTNDAEFARRARLATDKCYNREPGVTGRAPTFLANNYRMTELQGAVGLAQIERLANIIKRRRNWCEKLTRQLSTMRGISVPKTTEGCDHAWWFYLMRVDAAALGGNVDEFAAALQSEGLPVSAHYINQTIYEYPLFVDHSAFTRGSHPFAAVSYHKGLCPVAEEILNTCVMMKINEGYTAADLTATVRAIRRVVKWFNAKLDGGMASV